MAESSEAKVDVKLTILTRNGEVLALCYTTDCSEAEPSVTTLLQKGYEEVNVLPKPIDALTADSQLQFFIQAESDVEILPPVQTLGIQLIKSGSPCLIGFECYSPSGENTTVQLVIKEGRDVVDWEDIDVTCKKKDVKNAAGTSMAAFMSGGSGGKVNMPRANVKVVGKQKIYHLHVNTPAHQQTSNQAANSPVMSSRNEAKMGVKLTILTKTGEVLALCYTADCTEAKPSLTTLLQKGYDKFNVIPKLIEARAAHSQLQLSIEAESDVEIHPPVRTLSINLLKSGSPREMRFKCCSATGQNTTVQLVIKEGRDVVDWEDIDVTCERKAKSTAAPDPSTHQAADSPVTSSGNEDPSFFRRIVLGGRHRQKFLKFVNDLSYSNSRGGVIDGYDEENLHEPDFEVYCRMNMPIRFFSGDTRERMCCPTAGPLDESKMVSPEKLRTLITSTEDKTRVIALLGMAGSGKSTLIKRLVRDIILPERSKWHIFSYPTYGQRFKLVHFLNIKDIVQVNHLVDAREVLFSEGTLTELGKNDIFFGYEWAREHGSEVLFALDGLDQASWILPTDFRKIGYTDKASVEVVMANILSGNLFKEAKIILTSREHSVASLRGRLRPKTIIAMMGLDLKDVEKVFNSLTSSTTAFQTLSPAVKPLCTIPAFLVFCAVISILNPESKPGTMSAVLHEIIDILLHSENASKFLEGEEGDRIIAFLKSISLKAMLEGRVNFTLSEFQSAGITPEIISQFAVNVPFRSTLRQKMFDSDYKVFFNHQTLQEHFASMEICEQRGSKFQSFAFTELLQPHMSVVRRFVCGLLSVLGKNSKLVSSGYQAPFWLFFDSFYISRAKRISVDLFE